MRTQNTHIENCNHKHICNQRSTSNENGALANGWIVVIPSINGWKLQLLKYDEVNKLEILPELYHAIDIVQDIFNNALWMKNGNNDDDYVSYNTVVPLTKEQQFEWSMGLKELDSEKREKVLNIVDGQNDDRKSMDVSDIVIEELEIETPTMPC